MEVKVGYKLTDVGVIPNDWNADTLISLTPMGVKNNIVDGPFGSNLKTIHYRKSGIPIITSGYVTDGKFLADRYLFVDEAKFKEEKRSAVKSGDIVMAKIGERCGASAILPDDHEEGILSGNALKITIDLQKHSNLYIWHVLWNLHCSGKLEYIRTTGAQPAISMANLKNYLIPIPPTKDEEDKIAEALSDADALIESLEKLIEKKRQIKQGAMQELLTGKKRLAGFSGDWEEITLINIAEGKKELFDDGDWIEAEHITNQGVRLIQTGNIGIGKFTETSLKKYIYPSSFLSLKCKELIEGDLLICRLADPAGRACVLPNIGEEKTVTSVDVTIFRPPKSTTNRMFLAQLFSTKSWFDTISDRCGGTTHKRISRGALGQIKIKFPKIVEQNAIAEILTEVDLELTVLETKLNKACQIKQGMMQELLTGRVRLV